MLAIALVPSLALFVTGGVVAGLLIDQAISAKNWANYNGANVDTVVRFVNAMQDERTASLRALGGDRQAKAALPGIRSSSDAAIAASNSLAPAYAELNPDAVAAAVEQFGALMSRVPSIRQGVDLGQVSAADLDGVYSEAVEVIGDAITSAARTAPDSEAAAEGVSATDLEHAADLHSRAVGRAAAGLGAGTLGAADRAAFAKLSGGYHHQLDGLLPRLGGDLQARYRTLTSSTEWRQATTGEDTLAQFGTLPMPLNDWLNAQQHVSSELLGMWGDQYRYAEDVGKDTANRSLVLAIVAVVAVLVVSVGAFLVGLRLANGLIRRLRSLRTKTLELAEDKLPSMVQRLHDGEPVDVEAEMAVIDDGDDEIGQVAEAFNTAQRTAAEAAAAEAKTRSGISKVFLDIAHRSQIVVHRQLEVLDVAEAKQGDPEHLEMLFKLDHLATRARRNAENLLILGGGQPGRKWRKPVALEEIVRSAISETEGFERVSAVRLPEVRVLGSVVADLVHLLAELVDNAISFSPPDAPVTVRGNLVGKGAVIEVEDQGLGIEFEELERLNEALRNPPDFHELALSGQRNLGLFVIGQLAQRHGIAISLLESAYGGVKAIALIPLKVLDEGDKPQATGDGEVPPSPRAGRHHQRPNFLPEAAQDPVPRMAVKQDQDQELRQWPAEEPPPGPGSPPPVRTSVFESFDSLPPVAAPQPQPTARTRAPLPRRRRQAHLAPQLQLDNQQQPTGPAAGSPKRLRSPEEARNSMASFQRGTSQAHDTLGQHNR